MKIAEEFIVKYNLNCDQAAALHNVAKMFDVKTARSHVTALVHGTTATLLFLKYVYLGLTNYVVDA